MCIRDRYNKLSQYLASIDEPNRNTLMATFVHNIDKNKETDLEDAVDVADAIGSIQDDNLIDYLLSELKKDYERTYVSVSYTHLDVYKRQELQVIAPQSSPVRRQSNPLWGPR